MDIKELVISTISLLLIFVWITLLIHFILKNPELSNWKIGFYFTVTFIIISVFIPTFYLGRLNLTEIIGHLIFNLLWLLIPVITFISSVIRRIRFGKKNLISDDKSN